MTTVAAGETRITHITSTVGSDLTAHLTSAADTTERPHARTRVARIGGRDFRALVFDMDGVVTDTAAVHMRAWRELFGGLLHDAAARPFTDEDYRGYVDGRSRIDGIAGFLASRAVHLPLGEPDDPPTAGTQWGLANRKNDRYLAALEEHGVRVFPDAITLLRRLRSAGVRTALVTASHNAERVLTAADIADMFDTTVDGNEADRLGLAGKPDPALFTEAAHRLDVDPSHAVVIEDALSGVRTARSGGFGVTVGVNRTGHSTALAEHGADLVVRDLSELPVEI